MRVENPDSASLLALLVGRLLKEAPAGQFEIASGEMRAFIRDGVVTDAPCEPEASIKAPLSVLTAIAAGDGAVGHYLAGRVRIDGNIFKLWALYRAFGR